MHDPYLEKIGPIKNNHYEMPTQIIFGRGALREIGSINQIKNARKIVLVAGRHFTVTNDYPVLIKSLSLKTRTVFQYPDKLHKSDLPSINNLTDYVRRQSPDFIIAIGGGAILDSAKCAAILAMNEGAVEAHVRDKTAKIENKGIPMIAIPTTAGSGSEVTPWAVTWDMDKKAKYSLSHPLMFPELAIVDPSLTDELPAKVTAESGIDALTQAIESYWSVHHNPTSDKYALEAIKLAMTTLETVVNHPEEKPRDNMSKAALLAGLAFNNTQTTICHSVSYPMTANFGVAHGQAVSIALPSFVEYSLPAIEGRSGALLKAIGVTNTKEAAEKIRSLMKNIGLKTRLTELGITEYDIDLIVKNGFDPLRAKNAPRIPTPKELKVILKGLL